MARDRSSRPEAKPHRLFLAVEIPERAQDAVDAAILPWREALPMARWAPRVNRHVTLKFLGPTWPRLVGFVEAAAAEAAARSGAFDLRLAGVGRFPERGKARVLWVRVHDDGGALAGLAAALDAALAREFAPETRPFSAHLTVARSNPALAVPDTWTDTPVEAVGWRVEALTLFESHLQRPHARYESRRKFQVGG